MSQDIVETISEFFRASRSEFDLQYEGRWTMSWSGQFLALCRQWGASCEEETSGATTNIGKAVAKIADSRRGSKTPSNKGRFEVLNSLKQDPKKEETVPSINAELAHVINAMVKLKMISITD